MHRSPPRILLLLALSTSCDGGPNAARPADEAGSALATSPGSVDSTVLPRASSRPMMIEFTRDYCLPCQVMAPWVAELQREHAADLDVVEVNIDREKNERFALFFAIQSVPTQVFVDASGNISSRHEGVASKEEMKRSLRRLGWIP